MVIVVSGLEGFEHRVSEEYVAVVGENARVWLIEDAWHLGGPTVIPDEYRQRMLEFFETSLE